MGASRFFRRETDSKASAFEAIPDEVRQAIANDIVAIIECVKAWRAAVQSPEHGKAMADEAIALARGMGGKFVTMAMTGKTPDFDDPEFWFSLNLPEAIKDIFQRAKNQIEPAPPQDVICAKCGCLVIPTGTCVGCGGSNGQGA